ncbi:MAG: hypothetical protein MJA83_12060 [Gammaproteobacteria bacterium]|nr:hypothetical protein [Gammaproteobacteria bacterium]
MIIGSDLPAGTAVTSKKEAEAQNMEIIGLTKTQRRKLNIAHDMVLVRWPPKETPPNDPAS